MSSGTPIAAPAPVAQPAASRATWREWAALATLMLPLLLIAIDNTVLNFALPQISLEFTANAALLLWIVDAYPLVLAGLLVTMGSLGDRLGRRRMLLIGSTGFAVVSALAAFAPTGEMLVAARAVLGFFGAMLMPATLSIIRNIFTDRDQRRVAIAIWAAAFAAGAAFGPLVGGLLLDRYDWGSVFLIAVPVLIPALIFIPLFVPESKDPAPGPVALLDPALSIATLAPIVFSIKSLAHHGVNSSALGALVLGLAAGAWFIYRQLRGRYPMLDLRLFSSPSFTGSVLSNLLAVFSLIGFLYFAAQHLQLVLELRPLEAGLVFLPGALAMVVAGLIVVPVARRIPGHRIVASSLLLSASGYVVVVVFAQGASALVIGSAFVILALGLGGVETLTNDNIIAAVPPHKAGAASAISETAYEIGAVLGTAVLGTILATSYRTTIQLPDGLTLEQRAVAGETLGGAVSVADDLPPAAAHALLDSAHHAFDSGAVMTGVVAVVVMTLAAVLAGRMLAESS